jgi:hypothetical protein
MNSIVALLFAILWFGLILGLSREALTTMFPKGQREFVACAIALGVLLASQLPSHWIEIDRGAIASAAAPHPTDAAKTAGSNADATKVAPRCDRLAARPVHGGIGSLDEMYTNGVVLAPGGSTHREARLKLTGWSAIDRITASQGVCLAIDGRVVPDARTTYGLSRPDVSAAYGNANLTNTGFEIDMAPFSLSAGGHTVEVVSIGKNGSAEISTKARALVVLR